jgi:hypothetical protein
MIGIASPDTISGRSGSDSKYAWRLDTGGAQSRIPGDDAPSANHPRNRTTSMVLPETPVSCGRYVRYSAQDSQKSSLASSPNLYRCIILQDKVRSGRAGFPAAITFGGISDETTLPAPITLPVPMRTPFNTMAFVPMKTLSSITIG